MVELNEFTCRRCGDNQLTYQKWVKCNEDVIIHDDGCIEYCQAIINPDNELGACSRYICQNCGHPLICYGSMISTEKDLVTYLMMDQEERDEEERLYQEMVQEQIEKEISYNFGGNVI